jgi:hypothetical protein
MPVKEQPQQRLVPKLGGVDANPGDKKAQAALGRVRFVLLCGEVAVSFLDQNLGIIA